MTTGRPDCELQSGFSNRANRITPVTLELRRSRLFDQIRTGGSPEFRGTRTYLQSNLSAMEVRREHFLRHLTQSLQCCPASPRNRCQTVDVFTAYGFFSALGRLAQCRNNFRRSHRLFYSKERNCRIYQPHKPNFSIDRTGGTVYKPHWVSNFTDTKVLSSFFLSLTSESSFLIANSISSSSPSLAFSSSRFNSGYSLEAHWSAALWH
jgi:hypothetical protein